MNGTILLADDSPTIQKVVELTFSETSHEVVTASSGAELIDKLSEVGPDLVICDVIMPDRDGYDLCQSIKSDPATLHIPVVMLTGTFEPFDRDRAMAVGCDEIVTKPFEARHLIETVDRLLSGGAPVDEGAQASPDSEEYGTYLVEGGGLSDDAPEVEEVAPPEAAADPFEAPADAGEGDEASADEDALDFTATGFDEMEARAKEVESGETADVGAPDPGEEPEEGLDFTTTGFDKMEAAGRAAMGGFDQTKPESETDPAGESAPEGDDELDLPLEEREEDSMDLATEGDAWEDSFGGAEPSAESGEPGGAEHPELGELDEAAEEEPERGTEPSFGEEDLPPIAGGGPEPEAEAEPEAAVVEEPAAGPDPAFGMETPAGSEAAAGAEGPAEAETPGEAGSVETVPGAPLSDEDIERIARRVVEIQSDRLTQIAWEVIPDMAEILVRERIQQLEAEIDSGEGD